MIKNSLRGCLGLFILSLVMILSACNMPAREQPAAEDQNAPRTQAAETIAAQLTSQAVIVATSSQPTLILTPQEPAPIITLSPTFTASPSPTLPPTIAVEPTLSAKLVFEDDFSDDDTWWYEETTDDYGFELVEGGYRIYVNIRNAPIWSVREYDGDDVVVETDAARTDGADDGYYGVVCRHQGEDDYYTLVVSPDGSYGIARMENGEFEFVAEGRDQSGIILGGDGINRVRGECIGETLTLYANGHKLLTVDDDALPSGDVGVLTGTRQGGGIEVLFSYFAILEP